ncbi:S8 family peptidase [Sulfitobacter geojensis]|jgi:Subtilase family|uniref:S8 family peptidase n=1 Tax=Sulfitobacter geojensis TaxID=1342299 RepID=UPI0036DD05DB
MPNNPVQIILNDADFLRAPDPGQGGGNKDFFEKADVEFDRHKKQLLQSIEGIIAAIQASPYGPAAYLKVQMREAALAKSYRPVSWLFQKDQFPCVGADAVGTLYFRAPLVYLAGLRRRIEEAEYTVTINVSKNTGQPYPATSIARSEAGAIDSIEIAPVSGKRHFSTSAAMQMFEDPRTVSGYHVELFETPARNVIADDPLGYGALLTSLQKILLSFGSGARTLLASKVGRTPVLEFQLTRGDEPALVDNRLGLSGRDVSSIARGGPVDMSPERHDNALATLAHHPLVRAIRPPLQLQLGAQDAHLPQDTATASGSQVTIPMPVEGAPYPIVGIVDSGVSNVLAAWRKGRFDFLSEDEFDEKHGTSVAGILTLGQTLNDPKVASEASGCVIYDVPLFPKGPFMDKYLNGFSDFLEELEQAVAEASQDHGVKIFNLSINVTSDVDRHRYGLYAARLDQIADTYGVIFVNSAGNLPVGQSRAPWQKKPSDVVAYFASRTQADTIFQPAESVRSISVGALNPPNTSQVPGAPAIYSTRGPGLQVGVKPDVATYGGAGGVGPGNATGLTTITHTGVSQDVAGTSYAAPLISRTLAGLDRETQGGLGTEALRAMLLHHTDTPEPLTKRGMKDISRQFAGYGQPSSVASMLETDDHEVTMVFQSRLTVGARKPAILRFPFSWPQSLVGAGSVCSGLVKMTLVYSPPLDPAFGAEFVRVNLEATLRQRQIKKNQNGQYGYTSQIDARYLPKSSGLGVPEKALIAHGLKWWPSKQYGSNLIERGDTSDWRLEVSSLVRAEAEFPVEGVPFAVLVTIRDPDGTKPIFAEMRQSLQASRANAQDIKAAVRLRPRGR